MSLGKEVSSILNPLSNLYPVLSSVSRPKHISLWRFCALCLDTPRKEEKCTSLCIQAAPTVLYPNEDS